MRISAVSLLLGSLLAAGPAHAAVFVVDDTGDGVDLAPGDGVCATAAATCTLRAAIEQANALAGADIINFNIVPAGPKTIAPASILPPITTVVTIDGTTQPGYAGTPIIELDATSAGGHALTLSGAGSSGSTIGGLVINRSPGTAIRMLSGSSNNVIVGNYLGTDLTGTLARSNAVGVYIQGTGVNPATNNRIGGTTVADRNIISGNTVDGVQIEGVDATGNLVQGNYIGLDATGTAALGNTSQGVAIFNGAVNNTVGGTAPGAGNVISGNGNDGILIAGAGTTGNRVEGNLIGTNAAGTAAIANFRGVEIAVSAAGNTIGGSAAAANRIAYNLSAGVALPTAGTGNTILSNEIHSNVFLGIDLSNNGVTANDPGDTDVGPNSILNFPAMTAAFESGGTLTAYFGLDLAAGSYRIEFFKNPSGADPSGNGEGQLFTSSTNVTHPGGGPASFNHSFAGAVGDVITGTTTLCTDGAACAAFGDTSEFGNALTAVPPAASISSAANQTFFVGPGPVAISTITVIAGSGAGAITASALTGDIRIRIPATFP